MASFDIIKYLNQYYPDNPLFQAFIFGRFQILLGLAEIFIKWEKGKGYENKIKRATTALGRGRHSMQSKSMFYNFPRNCATQHQLHLDDLHMHFSKYLTGIIKFFKNFSKET